MGSLLFYLICQIISSDMEMCTIDMIGGVADLAKYFIILNLPLPQPSCMKGLWAIHVSFCFSYPYPHLLKGLGPHHCFKSNTNVPQKGTGWLQIKCKCVTKRVEC